MISFLALDDWANVGYTYAQALKSIGVEAEAYAMRPHAFQYPLQAKCGLGTKFIEAIVEKSDILVYMHSVFLPGELPGFHMDLLKDKKEVVFHGGSYYRAYYKHLNEVFNPRVQCSIIQTRDLFNLGAKNPIWVLPAVDIQKLQPKRTRPLRTKLIVGHFPSSPLKGTIQYILPLSYKMSDKFFFKIGNGYIGERVDWETNIKNISDCDIYIEALHIPAIPCQEFGVTALEASALGVPTITNFKSIDKYIEEYKINKSLSPFHMVNGSCGLLVANVPEQIENWLNIIYDHRETNLLNEISAFARDWVAKYHSYEAVGWRLMKKVFNEENGFYWTSVR